MSAAAFFWAVDAGNSAIKFAVFQGETLIESWTIPRAVAPGGGATVLHQLTERVKAQPPAEGIAVACARPGDEEELRRLFRSLPPSPEPFFVRHNGPLPLQVDYISGSPGPDRIANAMALRVLAPRKNALAIDFGTATHGEVVDRHGDFVGGIILPGLGTQLRALVDATGGRLPAVDPEGPVTPIGKSTSLAIRSGVILGQVGAAQKFVETTSGALGDTNPAIFLTGGWADLVKPHLGFPYRHESHLTLTGLMCLWRVLKGTGRLPATVGR